MDPEEINNPASSQFQYLAERAQKRREEIEQFTAPIRAAEQERTDYYRALKDKYSSFPDLKDSDYDFLDAAQTIINNQGFEGDAELERNRIFAAAVYANALNQPMDVAYQNLDIFHEQWTGQKFVKKTGIQAVADSLRVSYLGLDHNILAMKYHYTKEDPEVLKELQAVNQEIEKYRDKVPKIWQDEYVKQGGWADVAAFFRSAATGAAENAVPIAMAVGTGYLGGAAAGAVTKLAGLPAGLSGKIVAGAAMAATAESTAFSTVGTEYYDLISRGIPDDIAWNNANISAQIQGVIEALGGGVAGTTVKRLLKSAAPGVLEKAAARWFIKGKMGAGSKAMLDFLQEAAGEGFEEGAQQITSTALYNRAAEQTNKRREEILQKITNEPLEEIRQVLEKELEKYPEIDKKEFDEAWDEVKEAVIGGMGTALILGIPGATIGYANNVHAAETLADMAKKSPNEAVFFEAVNKAKEAGFEIPAAKELKTDEETALLSDVYKVQQERMTPEQREAKQQAARDAAALSEVTDYRNVEVEDTPELDENGKPTGGTQAELVTPDTSDIYREGGRLEVNEYTDANEDGSTNGRFVAGDPRVEDAAESGTNQYGYINYTENGDAVTIDEFRMLSGYESLRPDLYRQFAERFAGKNIQWTPKNEQNNGIKEQLVNTNPRGPKEGLNYYEQGNQPQASEEARKVSGRFKPYLKNSTPLETALAVETFGAFYRRRGESLDGAMNRLLGGITNEAPRSVIAAQRAGKVVKGATWIEQTAEGMRRIVYINKNAADSSTVVHEISHAVAADFTEAERNIASQALNGYKLKNGTAVSFEDNKGPWTDDQHEAFAEALENYLTNGTAPNEEIKGLFERIKEFMKRVYRTMKGWTELSPEAERFYKSLLSGELADEARLAHEEGRGEAPGGKREDGTANSPEESPEAAITRQRDAVIADPDISLENKAQAVFDAAGDALWQTGDIDPGKTPIEYLKAHTRRLDNAADRNQAIARIDDLARLYPPETNRYLAPNGKPSNLNHTQWYAVRTENFKKWFGDWENDPENASKIVDENGEPTPVFHGTDTKFDAFSLEKAGTRRDPGKLGKGFYFSTDKNVASTGDSITMTLFASAQNPLYLKMEKWEQDKIKTVSKALGHKETQDSGEIREKIIQSGYDGVILDYSPLGYNHKEIMMLNPEQVKSATDNAGTFDGANPSILFQIDEHTDADYFRAIESGDMETAQRIVDYQARQKGYISADEYRMNHRAPDSRSEDNFFQNLKNVRDSGLVPDDYWTTPKYYLYSSVDYQSFYAVTKAMNSERGSIRMYRAVPKGVKEDNFRNGDWITPSREYAEGEGREIPGGYRIIQRVVNIKDVWWDANSINEFGYDDGKDYAYKNTRNNRKLNDVIVRDYDRHIVPPSKRFNYRMFEIFYQTGDRDMMEEAAEYESGKEYRAFVEFMYDGHVPGYELDTAGLSEEALNAWYDEFVKKAKTAVESSNQTEEADPLRGEALSPAEKDRAFIEMISETKAHDDFLETLRNYTSGRYGYTDEDIESGRAEELRDLIQSKLKHPLWDMFFMAQGDIKESHKKKLLGLIRKYPREYRAVYSEVMERPEMAVSAEDTTAEILKHRITDSRRETVDTLSPEKLLQLSEQLDAEEYAEAVRKGTAKLADPRARKFIKGLDAHIEELETRLKKEEAGREEENEYLQRQVSAQFIKTFDQVLAAAAELEEAKGEVDQAIKNRREDLGKIARRAARVQADYWSITEKLDAYQEAQELGLHVRELLNEAKMADYAKSAREQARMARQDAKQELSDYAKSAREQNTMSRLLHKAETAQMKAALKEKYRQKEALKRLRAEDKRNINLIFQTPSASVAHEYGKAIGLIQRLFQDTMDETVKAIGEDAADYGLDTIMRRINEEYGEGSAQETEEAALKYLPAHVFYRIQDKPLSAWTIEERRELAGIITGLAKQGRELRKAQVAEYNRRVAAEKAAIAKAIKTVTNPELQDRPDDTPEEKERKRREREAIVNKYQYGIPGTAQEAGARRKLKPSGLDRFLKYNYIDNSRFVEYVLDGGEENGPSAAILTRRVDSAWNQRQAATDSRMKAMQDAAKKGGVSIADLHRNVVEIDLGGAIGKHNFTVSELIGVTLARQNEYSDAALRTGNFLHRTERNDWIKQMTGMEDDAQREKLDGEYMEIAARRYNAVASAAKGFFEKEENKKFLPVIEAMRTDYAANARRINEGLIEYNNTEIQTQKNYYPIDRVEPTSAYVQDSKLMRELVGSAASGFQMYVERGFTKGRIKIPPQFQSAINLDAMSVWVNSVNSQEHFLAYGQLVKEVNRIYKDPNSEARIWIRQRYGEDGVKRLDRLIKDMVTDGQGHENSALDDIAKVFRKNYSTAVLGFRLISGLKQVITSPAAFMGQGITPWEYSAALLDYLSHKTERWNEITALSEIMEHRSANFLVDEAKQEAATAADPMARNLAKFRKASMVFQEIADNITVAPGWYVLYKKEFNRLTEDQGTATLDVRDRKIKAVEYADKIISRVQPTGRAQDIAPVFKDNGELGKAFLQFTQQLSIIFQDLYYDTPVQIRRGRMKNVIGKFLGFITAGILVGLLTEAADGIGDDEDDDKKAARFIAYGLSQFTDSLPFIGTSATDTINLIATGKMQYHVNGSPFRAIESGAQSVQNIVRAVQQSDSEKALRALQQGLTTLGYMSGLPAAQFNDLIKTAQKLAGE